MNTELETVWNGSVQADHRGLLDKFRGLIDQSSATHETRRPSESIRIVRPSPNTPHALCMTQLVFQAIVDAGHKGIARDELLQMPKATRASVANSVKQLRWRGLVKTDTARRGIRHGRGRFWASQYAPEWTR